MTSTTSNANSRTTSPASSRTVGRSEYGADSGSERSTTRDEQRSRRQRVKGKRRTVQPSPCSSATAGRSEYGGDSESERSTSSTEQVSKRRKQCTTEDTMSRTMSLQPSDEWVSLDPSHASERVPWQTEHLCVPGESNPRGKSPSSDASSVVGLGNPWETNRRSVTPAQQTTGFRAAAWSACLPPAEAEKLEQWKVGGGSRTTTPESEFKYPSVDPDDKKPMLSRGDIVLVNFMNDGNPLDGELALL